MADPWPGRVDSRNWGVNGVLTYSGGTPIGITSTYALPLYSTSARSTPYVTSYTNWQPQWKNGSFDSSVDSFLSAAAFPAQGVGSTAGFGNSTRYNPKVRTFPNLNENVSVMRAFSNPGIHPLRISRRGFQSL